MMLMLWTLARLTVVPLQLHRIKNRHRIDETGSGCAPLNLPKCRLPDLIGPFESDGISRELGGASQGHRRRQYHPSEYQTVRWDIIALNGFRKFRHSVRQVAAVTLLVLHHIKALGL